MATSEDDRATIKGVVDGVRDRLASHGMMANHVVVLAETIEGDGTVALWVGVTDEARSWHIMGMLAHATTLEQAAIHQVWREDHP